MLLKKLSFYRALFLGLCFITSLSCEDDVREITLFDPVSIDATVSATSIESGESVTFTDSSTKVSSIEWTFPGGTPATSTEAVVDVTFSNPSFDDVLESEVILSVKHIDNTVSTQTFLVSVAPTDALPAPIPFGGTAVPVPGVVEAEDYDEGGQGVAYNETEEENLGASYSEEYRTDDGPDVEGDGTNFNIGYTSAGEWLNYTVEVTETGVYNFDFSVASGGADGGSSIQLQQIAPLTGDITELGETGDFPNTGGWGTYTTVTIPSVVLTAGTVTLRANFTGGSTNFDKMTISSGVAEPLGPQNIVFITDDTTGDAGFITLLEGEGHTVEAEPGKYNNLTPELATELNGFDLVIISRSTNSGNFDAAIASVWAGVTKPVLNLSSYVARSSRLQFFDSANQDEGGGTAIAVQDAMHPIFTGIALEADNLLTVTAVNLHVIVSNDAGNGTLLGLTADGSNATIAEWDANTAAYDGGTVFPSKRMFLAATGGGYNYNDAGAQLFLNTVEYIISGTVVSGSGGGGGAAVTPLSIAFASDQLDEGGQDLPYVALLEAQGHTVDAVTGAWNNLDADGAAALNAFDLVIVSRNTNSGNFGDAARPAWITVTTPIMNLSAFVTRNNRFQNFDSDGFDDQSTSTTLTATDPNSTLWIGVNVTDGVTEDITTDGLDVSNVADAGTGTILASDPATGFVAIAEWDANTASYDGADVFAAKRMFFGVNSGAYALTTAGEALFLNAVNRLAN